MQLAVKLGVGVSHGWSVLVLGPGLAATHTAHWTLWTQQPAPGGLQLCTAGQAEDRGYSIMYTATKLK